MQRDEHSAASQVVKTDHTEATSQRHGVGETTLTLGLILAVASFGVYPSVMVWMLALFTLPVSVVLIASGVFGIRKRSPVTGAQIAGFGLLTLGFLMLATASIGATLESCALVDQWQIQPVMGDHPGFAARMRFVASWVAAAPLIGFGLQFWTDWSPSHRRTWRNVLLLVPLAALLVHFTLASIGFLPLSA